jgi:hypothetical protein
LKSEGGKFFHRFFTDPRKTPSFPRDPRFPFSFGLRRTPIRKIVPNSGGKYRGEAKGFSPQEEKLDRLNGCFPKAGNYWGQKTVGKLQKESLPISEQAFNA